MSLQYDLIDNVSVVCSDDYPDFVDSYIESADYDGVPMTDEQLDEINEDFDFVYECVMKKLW